MDLIPYPKKILQFTESQVGFKIGAVTRRFGNLLFIWHEYAITRLRDYAFTRPRGTFMVAREATQIRQTWKSRLKHKAAKFQ